MFPYYAGRIQDCGCRPTGIIPCVPGTEWWTRVEVLIGIDLNRGRVSTDPPIGRLNRYEVEIRIELLELYILKSGNLDEKSSFGKILGLSEHAACPFLLEVYVGARDFLYIPAS